MTKKLWTIRDLKNGWFEIMERDVVDDKMRAWLVVAKAYSLGRAEIVQAALIEAYGGEVFERPRRSIGSLRALEEA